MTRCKDSTHKWHNRAGYPYVERSGRRWLEHRWVYLREVGLLFQTHVVHHTCGNIKCVEPEHLQQVTRAEHVRIHRKGYEHNGGLELAYKEAFDAEEEFSKTLTVLH